MSIKTAIKTESMACMRQFILVILVLSLLAGCGEQDTTMKDVHTLTTGKLGLWINPKQADMKYYDEALEQARTAQIQIAHLYVQWGLVEKFSGVYDWQVPDYILGKFIKNGFEAVVVIPIIFTTKLDIMPSDVTFTSFSEPAFVDRFVQFTKIVMDRYADTVKYLIIGNEIDVYLTQNPEHASDFKKLVKSVAAAHDVPVGTEFAIHSVVQNNNQALAKKALAGDIVFFTFYPTGDNFSFGGDTQTVDTYFSAMFALAQNKKLL